MTMERDNSAGEDMGGSSEPVENKPRRPGGPSGELGPPDLAETLIKPAAEPVAPTPQSAAGVATPPDEDIPVEWEPGMEFLDYKVKEELGRGSFGTVHKVHHRSWNVDLAVKSSHVSVGEEDIVREAEVWMELGLHPNIVSCHFVRVLGGIPRIFVEYVEGGTLADWLYGKKEEHGRGKERIAEQARELTRAQRLGIAIEICRGMRHAHSFEWTDRQGTKQIGLVHRDLKPLNVLMTADGVPRVTDFGLVRFGNASAPRAPGAPAGATDPTLVRSICQEGGFVGTPAYAAPEQWGGRGPIDRLADIYAFGVILYELLCGRRPFELTEEYQHAMDELKLSEYRRLHCEQAPPDPTSHDSKIDAELSALTLRCLAKDPQDRPYSFTEVNDQLKVIYQRLEEESFDDLRPEPEAAELLADSLNNRALSYLEIGQPKRAEPLWDDALKADPHHPESTYNRGLVLWRSARMTDDELVRQLEEVRASHPEDWRDEHLLGLVHIERGDAESAVRILEQVATHTPSSAELQSTLSIARAGVGQWGSHLGVLEGHKDIVNSVAVSADGRLAISGSGSKHYAGPVTVPSSDSSLRLWDLERRTCLRILEGHGDRVLSVYLPRMVNSLYREARTRLSSFGT